MNEIAKNFLARCFAPGSTIALLLRTESPAKTQQRVVTLEQALAPRYLGWLAHENSTGANIYVAANPLRPASRKRTKECIAAVRHLYLDLDTDGEARLTAYNASKAAVAALTKTLAIEWATSGVCVNALVPGVLRTELNSALLEGTARGREFLMRTPMKRYGKVEELGGAAVFLASDAASFVTGHLLVVDGGFLASGVNQ